MPLTRQWHVESARTVEDTSAIATDRDEQILTWTEQVAWGSHVQALPEANLMVDAPYEQVLAAVKSVLQHEGGFKFSEEERRLADMPEDRVKVMLSRHLNLLDDAVRHFEQPKLDQWLSDGLITAEGEKYRLIDMREHWSEGRWSPAMQRKSREVYAYRTDHYGLLGRSVSKLTVSVHDASALFDRAATAVVISRGDTYPNPDATMLKQLRNFNVLSPGPTRTIGASIQYRSVDAGRIRAISRLGGHATIRSRMCNRAYSCDGVFFGDMVYVQFYKISVNRNLLVIS